MIKHPIESNFYVNVFETAVEVVFAPTRSRYTYRRLVEHKELTSLLASSPIVEHPGRNESVGYMPGEVQAMAYRVALATARRLRPNGNLTGVTARNPEFGGKRFELLHEMLPRASRFAGLVDSNAAVRDTTIQDAQAAALSLGLQMQILTAGTSDDIDTAFAMIAQMRPDALLIATSTLFLERRVRLATLAAYHRLPAIFGVREFVEAGGLMSYGARYAELYRQLGIYSGCILKDEKPSDLPVWRPTQFEFVINRGTAKTLGIEVPPQLLSIADDVIE
jgi:putative ABC transport system substrate-binding protein